jgi:glycosyltransferase involved in cell wall biosynthesis
MAKRLRIGVNALFLIPGGVGGTEVYLRNLLAAFANKPRNHQFIVFVNRETEADLVPNQPGFQTLQTGVAAVSRPRRILYEQLRLPHAARAAKIDVLFNPGFTAPLFLSCPNVTLIHDLQHHHHPEFFKRADLLAWRFLVWASIRSSERVITVSEAAREDIHATYGVPLDRILTAEPGVEPEFFSLERKGNEPLILCVSTLHPHKNIERLVDAFAAFRVRRPEYRLILAGMHGFHGDAVKRRIQHHGLESQITVTGWIPRPEILELYSRAQFAVFPSTFEGFGIPVVEAMAAGVPLITSDIRPMKDAAGGTALLFPPGDTQALTSAMEQFAASATLRASYASRARRRAARFTWDCTANTTLDALEQAARG